MLEAGIIRHCAPTLAGIKTANMFSYRFQSIDEMKEELLEATQKLNEKGVFVEILRTGESKALIYVYRKKRLESDFQREGVLELLTDCGYCNCEVKDCLGCLRSRLFGADFPHEIGLFLGYPFQDVKGFIEEKGQNYKCRGLWKVYGDEDETKKLFKKIEKCAEVYGRLFAGGRSITKLTVAA